MKEQLAREKLTIIDTIKENASVVLSIGGFCYLIFQFLIMPVAKLQYQVANILDNHLATIQTELTVATAERKAQTEQIAALSEQLIRLTTQLELKK